MDVMQEEVAGDIGSVPRCQTCKSERVVKDAWACWNPDSGLWELEQVFDQEFCQTCEAATTLVWSRIKGPDHGRTRELNDRFRMQSLSNGSVVITAGIEGQGQEFVRKVIEAVRTFSEFSKDNDPWGEHDFGAVQIDDQKVCWKMDYYDPSLQTGSENPANEGKTHRVLTIMLASEY